MESCCTAVGMNNAGEVWAGGGRGIYRYDGDAWQGDLVLPHNFLYINDIDMCTSGEGWAVGQDYLLHFDGSAWRFVTMLPTRSERIATLGGPADQRLWVAGQPRTISSGSREALLAAPPISPTPPGETAVPFTPMPNDTPTPTRGAPIPEPTRVVTEVQPILLPDLHTGR